MKRSFKKFTHFFFQSAWYYTRPILAFDDRHNWLVLVLGIVITNLLGSLLTSVGELAFTLVNVGSFLGTVLCVLPRHSHPIISSTKGILLLAFGSSIGILFQKYTIVIIPLFCLGLYVAGISRNFSIGMYIRWLFASIAVLAGSQLRGTFPLDSVWKGLAAVIIGMSIVSAVFCLLYKHPNSSEHLLKSLYEQLYFLVVGQHSDYINIRVRVRESIEVIPRLDQSRAHLLKDLIKQADQIAGSLRWNNSNENITALKNIISIIEGNPTNSKHPTDFSKVNPEIRKVFFILQEKSISRKPSIRGIIPTKEGLDDLKDIVLSYRGSSSRFAIRLVLTGFICYIFSIVIEHIYPLPLENHGFWVALAGTLMVMPGSHGTMGRITSRTIGTIVGAVTGIFLSLALSNMAIYHLEWHFIIATILIVGYETVRKMSQAFLMFSVTLWLTFTLGGYPAGITRMWDVILGAAIAFAMFFIFPTWHNQILQKNITTWIKAMSSTLANWSQIETTNIPEKSSLILAYRLQARVEKSIQEIILENAVYHSQVPTENLLLVQKIMETMLLQLIQIQQYLNEELDNISGIQKELMDYRNRIDALSNKKNRFPESMFIEDRQFPFFDRTLQKLAEQLSGPLFNGFS